MNIHKKHDESGMALAELLVAVSILLVGLTATVALLFTALQTQSNNEARDRGVQFVRETIEETRALNFRSLTLDEAEVNEAQSTYSDHYSNDPVEGQMVFAEDDEEAGVSAWETRSIGDYVYDIRTDITWNSEAVDGSEYRSKEIRVIAYWDDGDDIDTASMSWIRTPSVSEVPPLGSIVEEDLDLRSPVALEPTYSTFGDRMAIHWQFIQEGVDPADLEFEIYVGDSSSQDLIGTAVGAARQYPNIEVDEDWTHFYVRAKYRGMNADSPLTGLGNPDILTVPDAPSVFGTQIGGSTASRFFFSPSSRADSYAAQWRHNGGSWQQLSEPEPSEPIDLPEFPEGGTIEFGVKGSNAAGSSSDNVESVELVARPNTVSERAGYPYQEGNYVFFSFRPAANGTAYDTEYRFEGDSSWRVIPRVAPNQIIRLNVADRSEGDDVTFRVRASNSTSGAGSWNSWNLELEAAPAEPQFSTLEQTDGGIQFVFNETPSGQSYQAQWRNSTSGSWQNISSASPETENFIPYDVSEPHTIQVRVRAENVGTGRSDWNVESLEVIPAPSTPLITLSRQNGATAEFRYASANYASDYEVQSRVIDDAGEAGSWENVGGTNPNSIISVRGSGSTETIELRVRAVSSRSGESDWRSAAITMAAVPDSPEIEIVQVDQRTVEFSLTGVPGATHYRAEIRRDDGIWMAVNMGDGDTITRTGENITWGFRARAVNETGSSERIATSMTMGVVPEPLEVDATRSGDEVEFRIHYPADENIQGIEGYYRLSPNHSWVELTSDELSPALTGDFDPDGNPLTEDFARVSRESPDTISIRVRASNYIGWSEWTTYAK